MFLQSPSSPMTLNEILSKLEQDTLSNDEKMLQDIEINGEELPYSWCNYNTTDLIEQAKKALVLLAKSENSEKKAKELGFTNSEHLLEVCFNYILKD